LSSDRIFAHPVNHLRFWRTCCFLVEQQCQLAEVSRAGFYRYLQHSGPEQADLLLAGITASPGIPNAYQSGMFASDDDYGDC
jgi:hypothetical protein